MNMKKEREFLIRCQIEYYNGTPIISNEEFDGRKLLYEQQTGDTLPLGELVTSNTANHLSKMYSMLDYFNVEDLIKKLITMFYRFFNIKSSKSCFFVNLFKSGSSFLSLITLIFFNFQQS